MFKLAAKEKSTGAWRVIEVGMGRALDALTAFAENWPAHRDHYVYGTALTSPATEEDFIRFSNGKVFYI